MATPNPSSVLYVLRKLQPSPTKALAFFTHVSKTLQPTPPSIRNLMLRTLAHPSTIAPFRSLLASSPLPLDPSILFSLLVSLKRHRLASDAAALQRLHSHSHPPDFARAACEILCSENRISVGSELDPVEVQLEKEGLLSEIRLDVEGIRGRSGLEKVGISSESRLEKEKVSSRSGSDQLEIRFADDGISSLSGLEGFESQLETEGILSRSSSVESQLVKDGILSGSGSAESQLVKDVILDQSGLDGFESRLEDEGVLSRSVSEELDRLGIPLTDSAVESVLREARHRPMKALKFFKWAVSRPGYAPGADAYNAMLRVLARCESVAEFWRLVEEMRGLGFDVDIDSYVKILREFLKVKMLEDAVRLYEFMMDGPYKPATNDCGLLLRQISLVDPPDIDLVARVVDKFESDGHELSKVVYDGILRSYARCGRLDEAGQVMERMREAGFEPDNITYSQMVFGLCKVGKLEEARKVLDEMETEGCLPDVMTWTVLIQGHFAAGEADGALACLKDMVAKNYEADGELLDVVVRGLCDGGRVGDGHTLFVEMMGKSSGVKPRQVTLKYLIGRLLEEKKFEDALRLLVTMKKLKLPPFADPFAPYLSKFGTIEDAKEFLRALNSKDGPSPAAYLILFKAFFKEGRYSEAQDLLFKSPHHIRKHSNISKLFGSLQSEKVA